VVSRSWSTSDILQVVLMKIENVQEVNIIAKSFKVNPYKKILSNGITFLLMVSSRGIIHARRWFHKWSSTLSDQIKKCYPHLQVVSQVNDTCYDIGGGAPPIGIKVKDPMWNLKSNHKVCHSNICGSVHQKCNIQVSTIYPNASLCIN
jgi:hypothetical protein